MTVLEPFDYLPYGKVDVSNIEKYIIFIQNYDINFQTNWIAKLIDDTSSDNLESMGHSLKKLPMVSKVIKGLHANDNFIQLPISEVQVSIKYDKHPSKFDFIADIYLLDSDEEFLKNIVEYIVNNRDKTYNEVESKDCYSSFQQLRKTNDGSVHRLKHFLKYGEKTGYYRYDDSIKSFVHVNLRQILIDEFLKAEDKNI